MITGANLLVYVNI